MVKILRHCGLLAIVVVIASFSDLFASAYQGFRELKESECVVLNESAIQQLPSAWHKYMGFIKACGMKKDANSKAKVFIVSIWAYDYLNAWTKSSMWENFPLPIIVDEHFTSLGTLPELFPMDSRTESTIYYGKWKSDIPTEIRIDVRNPTVTGDYHYAPLIWHSKDRQYGMEDKEPRLGHRPR